MMTRPTRAVNRTQEVLQDLEGRKNWVRAEVLLAKFSKKLGMTQEQLSNILSYLVSHDGVQRKGRGLSAMYKAKDVTAKPPSISLPDTNIVPDGGQLWPQPTEAENPQQLDALNGQPRFRYVGKIVDATNEGSILLKSDDGKLYMAKEL